jgi:hypothetical protein
MRYKTFRNALISLFGVVWTVVFHYESVRYFYLEKAFDRPLWKVKFLFPPAGWIMFYKVTGGFGYVEVYGQTGRELNLIDPHDIFRTRTIGFDNIRRNILSTVADQRQGRAFCRFLKFRFPNYEKFHVASVYYPSPASEPQRRLSKVVYQCTF